MTLFKSKEVWLFLAVSVLATAVDFSLYSLLVLIEVHYTVAIITGYSCGFIVHFIVSRTLVFKNGVRLKNFRQELAATTLVTAGGLVINLLTVFVLFDLLGLNPYLSRIFALILAFVWNYIGRKKFIYH